MFPLACSCNTKDPQAAKEVEASEGDLINVFERIEIFFRRLEVHTKVPPTQAIIIKDMVVKVMAEVLDILGMSTKEMKQSRASEFVFLLTSPKAYIISEKILKAVGITKLDDGLKGFDKMTNEEAEMATAEAHVTTTVSFELYLIIFFSKIRSCFVTKFRPCTSWII